MHRDVQVIHREKGKLDGLVVPGHILAYQAAATSVFATSLLETPYVIDPMTYIFQHPKNAHINDQGMLRASVKKMCESYHPDLAEKLEVLSHGGSLKPDDLPNCDEICQNVLSFQRTKVENASSESGTSKYRARYTSTQVTLPRAVIPPYFRFEDAGDEWYELSLNCAETTFALHGSVPVAPVIFTPISALTSDGVQRLLDDYGGFDQVFVWIDNYVETGVKAGEIRKIRQFVKAFDEAEIRVETLYGGYLMMLSGFDGLSGVSHGILYTQHKSFEVTPGSGGAPERYYIPAFHDFRSLSQTDIILHRHPELMCGCTVCAEALEGNPDNIIKYSDNPELLRSHFLTVRRQESDHLKSNSLDAETEEFRETFEKYHTDIEALPNPDAYVTRSRMPGLRYLNEWVEAFSSD